LSLLALSQYKTSQRAPLESEILRGELCMGVRNQRTRFTRTVDLPCYTPFSCRRKCEPTKKGSLRSRHGAFRKERRGKGKEDGKVRGIFIRTIFQPLHL